MSDDYLVCPACKSDKIREGGFTARYYYCQNCKTGRYQETNEDNYQDFLREGNRTLQNKLKDKK
jgi:transposase-like protein